MSRKFVLSSKPLTFTGELSPGSSLFTYGNRDPWLPLFYRFLKIDNYKKYGSWKKLYKSFNKQKKPNDQSACCLFKFPPKVFPLNILEISITSIHGFLSLGLPNFPSNLLLRPRSRRCKEMTAVATKPLLPSIKYCLVNRNPYKWIIMRYITITMETGESLLTCWR